MPARTYGGAKHFSPDEFDSPDQPGSGRQMDLGFIRLLDQCRDSCGFPFRITSGYRTPEHNAEVGGKSESAHTKGRAADIAVITGSQRFTVIRVALGLGFRRIGIGSNFIHLDTDSDLPQGVIWTY